MSSKPLPRHVVTIRYNVKTNSYVPHCNLCGALGMYPTWEKANNRRSTHLRGQDAGSE